MKQITIYCLISMAIFSTTLTPTTTINPAEKWASNLTNHEISSEDLTLILNLLYWSYARSNATLQTEKAYLEYIEPCLQAGQNLHHTRRNPSLKRPYPYALHQIEQHHSAFMHTMENYYQIADTYAAASEYVLNIYQLAPHAKQAIINLRSLARTQVMHTATSEVANFITSFTHLKESLQQTTEQQRSLLDPLAQKRSIVNLIAHWIPKAALGSMVAYDQQFINFTHEVWKLLMNAYEGGNTLWDVFERTRANLYRTYYTALYNQLSAQNFPHDCFSQAFDQYGFITLENRTEKLPAPIELVERP